MTRRVPMIIRKEAWPFYITIPGVRLCWEPEEPKGPKGHSGHVQARYLQTSIMDKHQQCLEALMFGATSEMDTLETRDAGMHLMGCSQVGAGALRFDHQIH